MLRAPYKWHSRQPIFTTDSASGARPIVFGEDSRCSSELRTFYLAAHGAGRDSDLRIIPEAFVFSGGASRHHVQPFSSPNQTGVRNTEPSFLKVPAEGKYRPE